MVIVLKGVPKSTQHCYKFTCRGKFPAMYMDSECVNIKTAYQWEMKQQKAKLLLGDLKVEMGLYFNTKGKHDIDNFSKLVLDAGTKILWEDDGQIVDLHIKKYYDKQNPRVELAVERFN